VVVAGAEALVDGLLGNALASLAVVGHTLGVGVAMDGGP
jgi:hypothetical protein